MEKYTPELGQAISAQPYREFKVPDIMEASLMYIRDELDRVQCNRYQRSWPCPFGNTGAQFDCDIFSVHAYSWGDDDQPWNFKYGNLEISWYKRMARGMSANMETTPKMASEVLENCLACLHKLETTKG